MFRDRGPLLQVALSGYSVSGGGGGGGGSVAGSEVPGAVVVGGFGRGRGRFFGGAMALAGMSAPGRALAISSELLPGGGIAPSADAEAEGAGGAADGAALGMLLAAGVAAVAGWFARAARWRRIAAYEPTPTASPIRIGKRIRIAVLGFFGTIVESSGPGASGVREGRGPVVLGATGIGGASLDAASTCSTGIPSPSAVR
jgi:hypothetical protein